jgi:hypothetical protein
MTESCYKDICVRSNNPSIEPFVASIGGFAIVATVLILLLYAIQRLSA